jgi:hypothetical protein
MKKNFEYKEPEFKVVVTSCEDILTASGSGDNPAIDPSYSFAFDNKGNDHVLGGVNIEL